MKYLTLLLLVCWWQGIAMAENYHGKVMSMDNRQAISEATIQFFNDNVFIGGGKSALDGTFSVSTSKRATKISVSYVGMETFVKNDSLGIPEDLGDICLNTFGISLGEVTVKGSLRKQSYDKDIYLITDSLRKGTSSSAQLLEKIPGVLRDWENDNLRVDGQTDIVVLVNQVERDRNYAMRLNPKRVKQIEIIHNPTGKYEGRLILINISLYDDYIGWELTPYTTLSYGKNDMNKEEVGGTYTYSVNKLSLSLSSAMTNNTRWESYDFERKYGEHFEKKSHPMDLSSPNGYNNKFSYNLSFGVEYLLSKNQRISAQAKGSFVQSKDSTLYNITENDSREMRRYVQCNKDKYYSDDYNVGVFYRGKLGKDISISSDLTYDYYTIKERRSYLEDATLSSQPTLGDKKHVYYDVSLGFPILKSLDFDFDYNVAWRKYNDKNRDTGNSTYSSQNVRHFVISMLSWHPVHNFSLTGGVLWMGSSDKSDNGKNSNYSWGSVARLFYKPWNNVTVRGSYHASMMYPNLDQLSATEYQVDSWMVRSGNPNLKPSIMKYLNTVVKVDKVITLSFVNFLNKDMNSLPYYSQMENGMVKESYANVDWRRTAVGLSGNYKLIGDLYAGGSLWYTHDAVRKDDEKSNTGEIYELDLQVRYKISPIKLNVQAAYEFKHAKTPTTQGKFEDREDGAKLVLSRSFIKGKLETLLTAKTPVNILKRRYRSETNLPFYTSVSHNSKNNYYGPYLSFSARLYLHGGKQVRMGRNTFNFDSEK